MTSQATARLARELKDLMKNPISGFKVELANEGNLFEWHVYIQGPKDTPQDGGIFKASLTFPDDYPNSPPKMKFLSDFWHPNVYPDGSVCISILHVPDPLNPQEMNECWRPVLSVESVLVSVVSMFADPNFSSPANVDASVELRKSPDSYKKRVLQLVEASKKALPPGFEMPKQKEPVKAQQPEEDFLSLEDEYELEDMEDEEEMEEEEVDEEEESQEN